MRGVECGIARGDRAGVPGCRPVENDVVVDVDRLVWMVVVFC
jgi:hypothetical protein